MASQNKKLVESLQALTPKESLTLWLKTIDMAKQGKVNRSMFEAIKAEATRREEEWIQHELVTITADGCMIPKSN